MIYGRPLPGDPLDQGDIIDDCPLVIVDNYDPDQPGRIPVTGAPGRAIVLTQACDLANQKAKAVIVAAVLDAQALVAQGLLKPADVKGPIRAGRVFGWYFLPKSAELGLPEMIVDLRQLHTVRTDLLLPLCQRVSARRAFSHFIVNIWPNTWQTRTAGSACRNHTKPSESHSRR